MKVSITLQIDGYSLEPQKAKMKAYTNFNNYDIVGEYEDASKLGKSIEGSVAFTTFIFNSALYFVMKKLISSKFF